jgi:putative transposase
MTSGPRYNPSIHNRKSSRLKNYDYSQPGLYFLTICCHERECLFGHIQDSKLILNEGGKIAQECWLNIPDHFPDAILHEFIIMPNHIHGIIELKVIQDTSSGKKTNLNPIAPPASKSISSIVRGYKIGVTKWFRSNTDIHTVWQSGFHDHIIRTEQSYQIIAEYITHNPEKWAKDVYNL